MAETPRIVVTNPVFPETRAFLEENATVIINEAPSLGLMKKYGRDVAMPLDCLHS